MRRRRAERVSHPAREKKRRRGGLGGYRRLAQTDAGGLASQVVGDDLEGPPGGVGGEAPRGEIVEAHAVLEAADGILDLGVAAMVRLKFQGVPPDRGRYFRAMFMTLISGNSSELRGSEQLLASGERIETLGSPGAEDRG